MRKYADPKTLSPEARALYEAFTKDAPVSSKKYWLAMDHYIMDDDMNAVPAAFIEWAALYGGAGHHERQIRIDKIGQWVISTVFLGIDHGYGDSEDPAYRPVLWESMIFWDGDEKLCPQPDLINDQDRYTSVQEAIAGHAAMVGKINRINQ